MMRYLKLCSLVAIAISAFAQGPATAPPPAAAVGMGPSNEFVYVEASSSGELMTTGPGEQTGTGPSGYVPPYIMVGLGTDGAWHYLRTDTSGNLLTSGGGGGGGVTPAQVQSNSFNILSCDGGYPAINCTTTPTFAAYSEGQIVWVTYGSNFPTSFNGSDSDVTLNVNGLGTNVLCRNLYCDPWNSPFNNDFPIGGGNAPATALVFAVPPGVGPHWAIASASTQASQVAQQYFSNAFYGCSGAPPGESGCTVTDGLDYTGLHLDINDDGTSQIWFRNTDPNWREGYAIGSYNTTYVSTDLQTVIGSGDTDGWSVGQTGGASIFELKGSDQSAYFLGDVTMAPVTTGTALTVTGDIAGDDGVKVTNNGANGYGAIEVDSTDTANTGGAVGVFSRVIEANLGGIAFSFQTQVDTTGASEVYGFDATSPTSLAGLTGIAAAFYADAGWPYPFYSADGFSVAGDEGAGVQVIVNGEVDTSVLIVTAPTSGEAITANCTDTNGFDSCDALYGNSYENDSAGSGIVIFGVDSTASLGGTNVTGDSMTAYYAQVYNSGTGTAGTMAAFQAEISNSDPSVASTNTYGFWAVSPTNLGTVTGIAAAVEVDSGWPYDFYGGSGWSKDGSTTFASLGTPAAFSHVGCTDCDTPLTEGAACSSSGDHAGALALYVRGIWICF